MQAHRWSWLSIIPLALVGMLCLSGCPAGGKKGAVAEKRVIILINGDAPFWDACRAGMQEAEKDLKLKDAGLRAVFEVNDATPAGQIEKLRQFASQSDITAIAISAIDADNAAIVDQLRELKKKGVHVITIDSDLERSKYRDVRFAYLGTDNFAGGLELGKCVKGLRPAGGELVTFVGRTGAQNATDRVGGLKQAAGPGFKALANMGDENDRSKARDNVRDAITNHPGLTTLVGIWAYNAPAIADIVEEKKVRQKYNIVVFDADPDAIKWMGKGMIDAMVVQNPYAMGYDGVKLMKALIKDDKTTIKEMLPKHGEKDGDIFDTGLKVVVPNEGSLLKADMFDKSTQFLKLSEFQQWLQKYKLTGS